LGKRHGEKKGIKRSRFQMGVGDIISWRGSEMRSEEVAECDVSARSVEKISSFKRKLAFSGVRDRSAATMARSGSLAYIRVGGTGWKSRGMRLPRGDSKLGPGEQRGNSWCWPHDQAEGERGESPANKAIEGGGEEVRDIAGLSHVEERGGKAKGFVS